MSNALARETSPYLRQHASNPVDWLPWGPEALARARDLDRPLLVSIGYSSCHWCHVMERESFEDPRTAALMNEEFVCVKVDREERPDIDALYMEAVQLMTGQGGWPLNVFLTPDQLPFYGGTCFPPDPRHGMPAWTQVLQAIAQAWTERREEIRAGGEHWRERLSGGAQLRPGVEGSGRALSDEAFANACRVGLDHAAAGLRQAYDPRNGGFAGPPTHAPKFPQASVLELLLLRPDAQAMALDTLRAMTRGGIRDQLAGGFHRYSVDASWTVPHFEKMLYDNALLARAHLHGWQASGDERLAEVCRSTLDWALREMRGPEGGFYSALDADSEGVEGRFYVWTLTQLREALDPEDADAAIAWLGVTEQGNFADPHRPEPGLNVLTARGSEPTEDRRSRIRARLLHARTARTRPGLDDKRITSWNALMIAALAEAGASTGLDEPRYTRAAASCAEFLLDRMRDADGRLLRTYNDGHARTGSPGSGGHALIGGSPGSGAHARIGAFLEDYAFLTEALIVLFESTCDPRWLHEARTLADTMIARFAVPSHDDDRHDGADDDDDRHDGTDGDDDRHDGADGDDDRRDVAGADEGRHMIARGFYSTASDAEPLIARRIDLEDTPIPAGQSSAAMGLLRLAQLTGDSDYRRHAEAVLRMLAPIAPHHPTMFAHALQALHWYLAPARPIACAVPSTATLG